MASFCTACGKALPDGSAFCPGCGNAVRHVEVPIQSGRRTSSNRRNGIVSAIVICVLGVMWFCGTLDEKREEPKKKEAIEIVQRFYAPGYNLQTLMNGQNWKDYGTWSVNPWPYGVSDEMRTAGMKDNWLVTYEVTVMDGLQEKKIEAEWGVDLNTKAHSAINTTAKSLFIGF